MKRFSGTVAVVVAACVAVTPVQAQAASDPAAAARTVPLRDAVEALPVADEIRDGYERTKFKHWIDADQDGCSTRAEVLLDEAVTPPEVTGTCTIAGGTWYSYYDDVTVTEARGLDIDHMVPLAEAWDSGAFDWTAQRRRDYANDLGESRALVAVTARSNRSKADQDPAQWMPPHPPARCTYITDWVTVKTRWGLHVDTIEQTTLRNHAADCPNVPITTTPARVTTPS
ncbi:HNH endonuclease family protein [Saccharothrix syringae]|uniref:HNH endonuclease n=1 Tax=Saccharothrix syringae TaxID=103733 RepID=A0A5Q0H3W7_SACSY|nr:HNH endonuclease family protein [Saccharothrix syringae]QFZ20500.1 HNH endonuclease [Saccharothrix syringae]